MSVRTGILALVAPNWVARLRGSLGGCLLADRVLQGTSPNASANASPPVRPPTRPLDALTLVPGDSRLSNSAGPIP